MYKNHSYTPAGDTPELCETGKEKVVRPTAQMHFKDVSYLKNKTHQLRVAKIQKSREEAETKAAKGDFHELDLN